MITAVSSSWFLLINGHVGLDSATSWSRMTHRPENTLDK